MTTTDLHDLTLPTLPEWGPDVPGTPVEATYSDGAVALFYAWRDGYADTASLARKCRRSPVPWMRGRITAVLADDPTRWVPVDADERAELGEHLVGARACSEWDSLTVVGPVARVDDDRWVWAKEGYMLAAPHDPLRVHPDDLAAAREAAAPKPPTCWDEWEAGAVWVRGGAAYRMGDDRVLRVTRGGMWVDTARQPGGAWLTTTLTAPTEEHMAWVTAADEAARLPDEPPVGSVVLDCDGEAWLRNDEGWASANDAFFGWDDLHQYGPLTVIHRAEP